MAADTRRSTLTLIGLGAVLGYSIFQKAGAFISQWQYHLLGFGIIAGAYWLFTKNESSPKPWWPILLLPCYALFQFATISIKPAATFEHFLRILAYVIVFLTVRNIAWHFSKDKRIWAAAIPIIAIAAIESAIGLIGYFSGTEAGQGAHGTYINRNHFVGLLEMALPFAIMGALKLRWLWIPAGVLFAGIVCSYSRGGFLSTLCALSLMGIILLGAKWTGRWKGLVTAPILIAIFFLFVYLPPDMFFRRFSEASESQVSTLNGRLLVLHNSPPLLRKYAVFGCGLGGFQSAFYQFQNLPSGFTVEHAFNDYIEGFVELGGVGFAIAVMLMAGVLNKAIQAGNGEQRLLAIACVGSLFAILLHSLVDYNLYIPANAMTMVWIAGIASQLTVHRRDAENTSSEKKKHFREIIYGVLLRE
jgi:hypothetical protein